MRDAVPIAGAWGGGTDALDKHPTNINAACTHYTQPPITTDTIRHPACFMIIHTDNVSHTTQRRIDTLQAELVVKEWTKRVFLMLNILRTPTPSLLPAKQTNHRNNHSLSSGCSPNES